MKVIVLALVLSTINITSAKYTPQEWVCVRWKWTGDVYNRKVICLEWKKRGDKDK
jgi:hypothetical protein